MRRTIARRAISTVHSPSVDGPRQHNIALSCLLRSGRLLETQQLFESLSDLRNVVTCNSMISSYVRSKKISLARKLFDEMPQRDVVSWKAMHSAEEWKKHAHCFT